MISYLLRFLKRVSVLVPGFILAYFAVKDIYPTLNRRVPATIAVLLTYIVIAYGLIPAVMRLLRIVLKPRHIPLYCITPDGFASDPINIGLIGNQKQIIKAMKQAGWYVADPRTPKTLLKMGLAILLKRPYPTAPFSNLYLFGRKQDLGFELPLDNNPWHRHHVRFWLSTPTLSRQEQEHLAFWQKYEPNRRKRTKQLWLGTASLDSGLAFIRHNAQITHMINPNTNAERDLIVRQLQKTGLVGRCRKTKIGEPYRLRNRVLRGYLHADGRMTICELK